MLGDVPFPAWQAHPDVWLLVASIAVGRGGARTNDERARAIYAFRLAAAREDAEAGSEHLLGL